MGTRLHGTSNEDLAYKISCRRVLLKFYQLAAQMNNFNSLPSRSWLKKLQSGKFGNDEIIAYASDAISQRGPRGIHVNFYAHHAFLIQ